MANFLAVTGRMATFVKEFQLADGALVVQLGTNKGSLVAVWSTGDSLTTKALAPILAKGSELRGGEGKPVSLKNNSAL